MNEEIVTVKGTPLLINGGNRDVVVMLSDLEFCITAIRKLQPHKALIHLETLASKRGSECHTSIT